MAEVRLADVVEPTVFEAYSRQRTTELWEFFNSGIIARGGVFNRLASQESSIVNIPFWNDLASVESNVGSDDPASNSTPQKIGTGQQIGIKNRRNQSWSAMDLLTPLIGEDPMREIASRTSVYWFRDMQNTLIALTNGLIADNVANDASDMVNDVGTDAVGAPVAAELATPDTIIDTWSTLGDASGGMAGIAMHSVVFHNLQKAELIDYLQPAETDVRIPSYLGMRVFVDDSMPAVVGANRVKYTSVIYGNGTFAYGEGSPRVPVEVDRAPAAGDGEGQETLYQRKHYLLHPNGFAWQGASLAGVSPTNAEHATATNWDRLFDRKNVRMAFLITNG